MIARRQAIIVDIDGTLANNDHRQHHVMTRKKDWKAFFEGIHLDSVNSWCHQVIEAMSRKMDIILVTGRDESLREKTVEWLKSNGIDYRLRLYMRSDNDRREDMIVKEEIYRWHIEPHFDVLFCLDDRPSVCRMWRKIGLTVLQCNDKEF